MKEKLDINTVLKIQDIPVTERALSDIFENIGSFIVKNREKKVRVVKIRIRIR